VLTRPACSGASVLSGITLTKFVGVAVLAAAKTRIFEVYYFRWVGGWVHLLPEVRWGRAGIMQGVLGASSWLLLGTSIATGAWCIPMLSSKFQYT
jgi:hypothetical protein